MTVRNKQSIDLSKTIGTPDLTVGRNRGRDAAWLNSGIFNSKNDHDREWTMDELDKII